MRLTIIRIVLSSVVVLWLVGTYSSAYAEDKDGDPRANNLFMGYIGSATLDRPVNAAGTALELTAGESSTIKLQFGDSYTGPGGERKDGTQTIVAKNWNVVLSAPLNQDNKKTAQVATLDGLADSVSLTANFNRFSWPGIKVSGAAATRETRQKLCAKAWKKFKTDKTRDPEKDPASRADFCAEGDYLFQYLSEADFDKHQETLIAPDRWSDPTSWLTLWGLSVTAGYRSYDYRDSSSLGKENTDELPWSIGGNAGFIIPEGKITGLVSIGYKYQESYKESDESTVCPPSNDDGNIECTTGSFGEPQKRYKSLGSLEIRGLLPVNLPWGDSDTGFSLKFTHDFKSDANGVDLPIYLFRNGDNSLNGGIRLGYIDEDDDDKFTISLFVGSPFGVFKS